VTLTADQVERRTAQDAGAAFEELFQQHWQRVNAVLFRLVGDRDEAEDLALDAFWRLYRLPPPSGTTASLGGWLYRVATNLGFNALRARKRAIAMKKRPASLLADDRPGIPRWSSKGLRKERWRRPGENEAPIGPAAGPAPFWPELRELAAASTSTLARSAHCSPVPKVRGASWQGQGFCFESIKEIVSMHLTDGELKAYHDRELSGPQRERARAHLESCPQCRGQSERLEARSRLVEQRLAAIAPQPAQAPRPVGAARSRLQTRIFEKENTHMFKKIFARPYRTAWPGWPDALLATALAFPPVQAIANSFLGLFRVQQISVVDVNPGNLLEQLGSSSELELLL
jgi:hypothetical protein